MNLFCIYEKNYETISRNVVYSTRGIHIYQQLINKKLKHIHSNFIQFGKVTSRPQPKTVTVEAENEINNVNILAYFNVNRHGSSRLQLMSACLIMVYKEF